MEYVKNPTAASERFWLHCGYWVHTQISYKGEKSFPVIEFLFLSQLFLKKMGWLWECLEMIFRMFPVYTQKTVPQRYLFFSICIGTSCQIMLRRLFNWYVTFFRKNILSFCIFPIGLHIFVKLHSSVFRNLLPKILQDIYLCSMYLTFKSGINWYPLNISSLLFWSEFCSHL